MSQQQEGEEKQYKTPGPMFPPFENRVCNLLNVAPPDAHRWHYTASAAANIRLGVDDKQKELWRSIADDSERRDPLAVRRSEYIADLDGSRRKFLPFDLIQRSGLFRSAIMDEALVALAEDDDIDGESKLGLLLSRMHGSGGGGGGGGGLDETADEHDEVASELLHADQFAEGGQHEDEEDNDYTVDYLDEEFDYNNAANEDVL
jgi:hypothetical protein